MDKLHSEFGFTTPIPDCVISAIPEIGAEGFTMFCYLMYRIYNDKRTRGEFIAWPSWENMEIQTKMSRRKIGKGLKALEDHGFLERKKRYSNSVVYMLTRPESQFPQSEGTEELQFPQGEGDSSLTVRDHFPQGEGLTKTKLTKNNVNQEQVNNNNKVVIVELVNFTIPRKKAEKYISEFGEDRCLEGLEYCKQKGYGPGALIKLLEEGWDVNVKDEHQSILDSWTFEEVETE